MDIPSSVIDKWQHVWLQICDMAYDNTNITSQIIIEKSNYAELLKYMSNSNDFHLITLDYMWEEITLEQKRFQMPPYVHVVPELQAIYVPRILFESLGVYAWFEYSFPNCKILFWEDDM